MILKLLNSNQKNFIQKLELILKKRKVNRSSKSLLVKKIISDVIKNKDQALIKYEKQKMRLI
jgi:histidinol dehydrogenase